MMVSAETIYSLENELLIRIASFFWCYIRAIVAGYRIMKAHPELIKFFNSLNDISKGDALRKGHLLAEESSKHTGQSG